VQENARLKQRNTQLKKSYLGIKQQLENTQQTSASLESLSRQVKALQMQLTESTQEKEALKCRITHLTQSNGSEIGRTAELREESRGLSVELQKAQTKCEKLQQAKLALIDTNTQQQQAIDNLQANAETFHRKLGKLRKGKESLEIENRELKDALRGMELEKQHAWTECQVLKQEIEDQKLQTKRLEITNKELIQAKISLESENKSFLGTFSDVESHLGKQAEEIQVLREMK
jgi:chromosome segregation ATPase